MADKGNIENIYNLTPMQAGMLFSHMMDNKSTAYFEQAMTTFTGPLDIIHIENAFNKLIEKYDILRTVFLYKKVKKPKQVVLKQRTAKNEYIDISHLPENEKKAALNDMLQKDKERNFDLEKDILMRIIIIKTHPQKYYIIWSHHHIVMDGWCITILMNDFFRYFKSIAQGQSIRPETAPSFGRYLHWIEQQDREAGFGYWQNYLEGYDKSVSLPQLTQTPKPGEENYSYRLEEYEFLLDESTSNTLDTIARQNNVTINNLFQAMWGILIQRYNNTDDVVFGAVVSGRPPEIDDIENMVGLFINTIPVRVTSAPEQTFSELIQIRHTDALQANPYEYLPLSDIQANTLLKNSLLDHIMVFENFPGQDKGTLPGKQENNEAKTEDYKSPEQSNYDFNVIVEPFRPILIKFSFNGTRYDQSWVKQVAQHFEQIINQCININILVRDIEITPPEEKQHILTKLNQTQKTDLEYSGIHQWYTQQALRTPEKIAVSSPTQLKDTLNPSACYQTNPFIFKKHLGIFKEIPFLLIKTNHHNNVVLNTNTLKIVELFDGKSNLKSVYSRIKFLENQQIPFIMYALEIIDLLEITQEFSRKPEIISNMRYDDFIYLVQLFQKLNLITLSAIQKPDTPQENSLSPEDFKKQEVTLDDTMLETLLQLKDYSQLPTIDILLLGDTPGTPSTGLLYLASFLHRNGINAKCRFQDCTDDFNAMKSDIENLLKTLQPKIIAISMKWFLYIARVKDMCRIIKEYSAKNQKSIKIVLGGDTASYYWEELIADTNIDCIIRGDGELPLLKLCREEDPANIPNCIYKHQKDNTIISNPISYINDQTNTQEVYLSNLDEILLSKTATLFGTFFIYTQRGCARNCVYCGGCRQAQQKSFNREKGTPFNRPVEQVRQDIISILPYSSTFQFDFDTAEGDQFDYCRQIWDKIDLSQHLCIVSRPRILSKALLQLAVNTFKYVYLDIDVLSLSQHHRKHLQSLGLVKPQFTDEEIMDYLQLCDMYENVEVRFNLIAGLPHMTIDDIERGDNFLSAITAGYRSLSELHWARLHAQPGAPLITTAESYQMHSFATNYQEFLENSRKNFAPGNRHQQLEFMTYPYIYFKDENLNSRITLNFTETNQKMQRYIQRKKAQHEGVENLTYTQLEFNTNILAQLINQKETKSNAIVAILLSPSLAIPLAILGVLKSGNGYLPIDPEFPENRIAYVLADSNTTLLITTEELYNSKNISAYWNNETIFINHLLNGDNQTEIHKKESNEVKSLDSTHLHMADTPCYIIYTSGTTGKPKGVMLTHRNLINYVQWYSGFANLSEKDNSILTSSFAFDLGYTSLYPPLLSGGTLHIVPKETYLWAEEILAYIKTNKITYLKMTPSLLSVLVHAPEFSPAACQWLRLILIGGEAIRTDDIQLAHQKCPQIQFINHYGPTEATIGCVAQYIDNHRLELYKKVPTIGKPIANTYIYINDKYNHLLPVGIAGELCIAGYSLSKGYLNHSELTAEKFYSNRYSSQTDKNNSNLPGSVTTGLPNQSKLYTPFFKSGDMARWQPEGNIQFLGRIDKQVKIRGYRVETGEIELQLQTHPLIEKAVITIRERENAGKEKYLAAYYVPKQQPEPSQSENNKISATTQWETKTDKQLQAILTTIQENIKKAPEEIAVQNNSHSITNRELSQTGQHYAGLINKNTKPGFILSPKEKIRYKRQMLLDGWGTSSQEKLKGTVAFVAGAGGGASPTLTQLACAGVGTIIICDYDQVELSNLNRQFLHDESRLGMNKALSAQLTIQKLNPHVNVIPITEKLTRDNVFRLVGDATIIFDMFDGLESKFILSECATAKKIPHIISAMTEISSYAAIFHWPYTPCYHCIFDRSKFEELNQIKNVIKDYEKNPLHVVASSLFTSSGFAVTESLKIILGLENPAYNKFFLFNQKGSQTIAKTAGYKGMTYPFSKHFRELSLRNGFDWDNGFSGNFLEELTLSPNPECPLCSEKGQSLRQQLEENAKQTATSYAPSITNQWEPKTVGLLISPEDYDQVPGILLGALESGKNLIPLDPAIPIEQLEATVNQEEIRIILTATPLYSQAEQLKNTVNKNIVVLDCELSPKEQKISNTPQNTPTLNHFLTNLYENLTNGQRITITDPGEPQHMLNNYSLTQLREYLAKTLPDYMIPSYFVKLDEIPMTPNGKVDRKSLPEPGTELESEKYKPPRNETEEKLVSAWAEILGTTPEKISIDSNFFELGGTSLTLIELVARIHKDFGVALPLNQLFSNPSIMKISGIINSKQYVEETMVLLNQKADKNLFAFPGGTGFAITFSNLANFFREHSFYSFNFIEDQVNLIEHYTELIIETQPTGPYTLFGYCAGGILADQVAKTLEDKGYEVAGVIMADATWDRDGTETYGENEREFVRQIEMDVQRMGLDFLKEKITQKTEKYQKYIIALNNPEIIHSQVHFIISETLRNANVNVLSQWEKFLTKPMIIHNGFGHHQLMLTAGTDAIEKNAQMIMDILNNIPH